MRDGKTDRKAGVRWRQGSQPDCTAQCLVGGLSAQMPEIWNTLPLFTTVQQAGQVGNIQGLDRLYAAAAAATLSAVPWVATGARH
jgi:hypothetical protein